MAESAGTSEDLSTIFLQVSLGKGERVKERDTTDSKGNHRNVDVVYDLVIQNHGDRAIDAREIKIVTQYSDQIYIYKS